MSHPHHENERNPPQDASYMAFLLRCWLEETDGEPAWRFTLVQLRKGGSKRGFANLEDVTDYLQGALAARARASDRIVFDFQNNEGE